MSSFAQQGINYKALIKDNLGNVLEDEDIDVQFIIYEGAALTNNVYQETQIQTTDFNGIIILTIGEGTTSDVFSDINWGSDEHWLNVQVNTGSGWVDMGTTKFMAVPYALSSADNTWVKNGVDTYTTSEKVGINTTTPEEALDVNGRIKVGDISPTSPNTEGAIRYNAGNKDFEGWNGIAWLSLTKSGNGWGNQSVYENESQIAGNFAYDNGILAISGFGSVTIYNYTNGIKSNPQTVFEDINGPKFTSQLALHNNKLLVSATTYTVGDPSSRRNYVYVFENQAGTWVNQAIINDPENSSDGGFGFSLDIQNNLALISSPYYNSDAGRVYLFKLTSGNWNLIKTFQGASPTNGFGFGYSISFSGNNISITETGNDKVYLYQESNPFGWVSAGTLTTPSVGQSFGKAVDLDNNKLLVTGYDDVSYIYEKTGGVWSATPSRTINKGGGRVEIKGNYLMILKQSKIHLFEYNNGIWGEVAQFSTMNGGTFSYFKNLEITDDYIVIVTVFDGTTSRINYYSRN
jgi:hypothetical protein